LPNSRGIITTVVCHVGVASNFSFSIIFLLLQEMVTVSVDGSVLDRIAKIMTPSTWIFREGLKEKEKGKRHKREEQFGEW